MIFTSTIARAPYRAALKGMPKSLAGVPLRHISLANLRSMVATWDKRIRFRAELARMLKDNPYLVDDVGLTMPQAEAEILKLFWQRQGDLSGPGAKPAR